jgi:hypothetical protein
VLQVRRRAFLAIAIAIGIAVWLAPPAQADELADVQSLQTHIEAAGELVEAPTDTDWGVPDLSTSLPAVAQDAPEVPVAPVGTAPEPRYHVEEPQYHAEYQPPPADPAPSPAPEPAPAQSPAEVTEAADTAASIPVTTAPPTQPETPSTPTIWIWVWNWNWVAADDDRYHNPDDQYQIDTSILDKDVAQIIKSIGVQMPVQISITDGSDIAQEILLESSPEETVPAAAPTPLVASETAGAAPVARKGMPVPRRRFPPSRAGLERALPAPLPVVSADPTNLATSHAAERRRAGAGPPRVRRPSRPEPTPPLPAERFADSAAATGGFASSLLKTIAILALSLMLAAFGHGRRIWLPAPRLRGLLGTRTDPPG